LPREFLFFFNGAPHALSLDCPALVRLDSSAIWSRTTSLAIGFRLAGCFFMVSRANAGNGHETAADGVVPDNRQQFPVQLGELLAQLPPGAQCSDEALRKP
jgi:hypothetical protein